METYKIIAFIFSLISVPLALLLAKSITLGATHKINSILSLALWPTILWFFYLVISLFGWWALLVIPISWGLILLFTASFINHLANTSGTAGLGLLEGQVGYAFLMWIFLILSIIPYIVKCFI